MVGRAGTWPLQGKPGESDVSFQQQEAKKITVKKRVAVNTAERNRNLQTVYFYTSQKRRSQPSSHLLDENKVKMFCEERNGADCRQEGASQSRTGNQAHKRALPAPQQALSPFRSLMEG